MSTEFDVDQALGKIPLPEKIKLLTGEGWWSTHAIPVATIKSMRFSDGPNGVRGTRFFNGVPSSCFPASTGLGSSFDVDLARRVGEAIGAEARAKSCHVLLGPTVNTQRSPLGGRSFESFSEDPHLNGTIAAAYINGLQSTGVSATIKHYVANDQEFQRFSISSEVSERALREIYLKPFQIAIKNSNPRALMSAYNRVNGVHVSESHRFLTDILRKEWKYEGMIMSDWIGVYSTVESIKAGLDLEMPGPSVMRGKAVERAMLAEKLFPADIDERVRKILGLYKHALASGIPFDGPEGTIDTEELRKLLRTAAADSIVLLKNDKKLLPLPSDIKKIAVIGPNAKPAMTSGGGSAHLRSSWTVSPLQGIQTAAKDIGAEVEYAIGVSSHNTLPLIDSYIRLPGGERGALIEFWNAKPSTDFMSLEPNFDSDLTTHDWSTTTSTSNCFMADGIDVSKVNEVCFMRYCTQFIPDESGEWEFALSITGRGNLFVDRKLVIELSQNPAQGSAWFGMGTIEKYATLRLEAGKAYNIEIRLDNAEFIARGIPIPCYGGIRLGAFSVFDPEQGIKGAVDLAAKSDVVILVIGLNNDWESEGFDRQDINLPGLTNRLVGEVTNANPNTVVVNQSGAPVAMPWINHTRAVLQAFYGGNELGNGLADVLFGKVNPSAKLALTFPERLEDSPAFPSYGDKGQEYSKILYNEGIFVGYRGFEICKNKPLFPFGFGESYASFEYSGLEISLVSAEAEFVVSFTLTNVGEMAGREVAQVYVADPQSSLPRALKELKGFAKVDLAVGETKKTEIKLDREALGFYDDRQKAWVAEAGTFHILVGASSVDIKLKSSIELQKTLMWTGL